MSTLSTEDRLDILDLLARADNAATRRDPDAYVALFTEDAILDGAKGDHRGREILRQSVTPIWQSEGAASMHLTLNAVLDSVEGQPNQVIATSTLLILSAGPPTTIHNVSTIAQYVVKRNGAWRISRRSVRSF